MIVDVEIGEVFPTPCKHIAFGLAADKRAKGGFESEIIRRLWPELATLKCELGDVLHKEVGGHILHAIACYNLDGTDNHCTLELLEVGLNSLEIPEEVPIAMYISNTEAEGSYGHVSEYGVLGAIARSDRCIVVYRRNYNVP